MTSPTKARSRQIAAERAALGLDPSLPLPFAFLALLGAMSVVSAVSSLVGL